MKLCNFMFGFVVLQNNELEGVFTERGSKSVKITLKLC